MRNLLLACALLVATSAAALAGTSDRWKPVDHSMNDALKANFTIVDTFYDPAGNLVFVLQRGELALLCLYGPDRAFQHCLELGDHD